jgi:type IV pilus assembly protein PilE
MNSKPTQNLLCRASRGFSLIELMAVVTIVGILTLVAIPSYRQYLMRTHRTEAKSALLRLAANQERFYLTNNTYTTDLTALGFDAAGNSENSVYTLAVDFANATTFQATATPTAGGGTNGVDQTTDADCQSFTINAQGVRTAAPDPTTRCW